MAHPDKTAPLAAFWFGFRLFALACLNMQGIYGTDQTEIALPF